MTDPLAAMKAKFVRRCAEDLVVLRQGEDTLELRAIVHRIAGAAGMFGYPDAGSLALGLDQQGMEGGAFNAAALETLAEALETIARTTPAAAEERRAG